MRKMLSYPPFGYMARLVIRGPLETTTGEFAGHLAERLKSALADAPAGTRVLGPAPAPFAKLRGKYRFGVQLQAPDGDLLRAAVCQATEGIKPPENVQWIVDVDPLDML